MKKELGTTRCSSFDFAVAQLVLSVGAAGVEGLRTNGGRFAVAAMTAMTVMLPLAHGQTDYAEGMRLYTQKANCQACHGWAGDGRKMDNQMPDGPSLRETKLDREAITLTIKCGRPGRSMPAFDRFAYSDGRCYGMTAADLKKSGQTLNDPAATLQPREIETLVDFLFAKVVGQGPMTRAKCAEYWGSEAEVCREIK